MNFRLIEPQDLSEIIDVRGSTRENPFSREALRQLGITEESTAKLLRTTHRGWLCEEEGRAVGFSIGDGKTGELWVIAVLPAFEGRGVGSRLLEEVEAWLWSLGWNELWLWTSPDQQKRAFTFYQKHGWLVSELKDGMLYMKKRRPHLENDQKGQRNDQKTIKRIDQEGQQRSFRRA
jgi:GNAT superfamily N-acetyltransferase